MPRSGRRVKSSSLRRIDRFEDIIAWQKAGTLALNLYNQFKNCRDFSLKDQMYRAAISIINNIAEGLERNSARELRQFLFIAKGSCGEVRSMLYLAAKLNYINGGEFKNYHILTNEISKLISGFIKTL